jgi:PAS domain S-box-containing protein
MRWHRSLHFKLFITTVVAALLPLLIVAWFFRQNVPGELRTQLLDNTRGEGEQAQAIFVERADRLLTVARATADDPDINAALAAQRQSALTTAAAGHLTAESGTGLTIVDASGRPLVNEGGALEGDAPPPPAIAGSALSGLSGVALARNGANGLRQFAYAPVRTNEAILGAVFAVQDIDSQFVRSLQTSANVQPFAILPNGEAANTQLSPGQVSRIQSATEPMAELATVGGVPSAIYSWQLRDSSGAPIAQLGIVQSAQEMQQALARLRFIGLLAASIALLGAGLVAWVLSRFVLRPLNRISAVAQEIASGQRVAIRPLASGDEVGILTRSLSTMVDVITGNEERLQRVIETMAEGILVLDKDGCYRMTNAAAETMLGFSRSAILGNAWYESPWRREQLDGSPLPESVYPFRRIQETNEPVYGVEFAVVRPDDGRVIVSVNAAPLSSPDGTFAGTIISFTDVTERRRAEQQRAEALAEAERSRARAKAVIDASHDGMVLVAPDSRFVEVNPRFCSLFGADRQQILDRTLTDLAAEIDRAWDDPDAFREFINGSESALEKDFDRIFVQRWPERREVQIYSTPVTAAGGKALGRLFAFHDVTREREVDRMKTEFVSLVSHELRTPLTSIKGYVDLLLDGEVGPISDEQGEFLAIVKNNADRLVGLVSDLLNVSRIESGRVTLRNEAVDVEYAINQVATLMHPQLEQKRQHLRTTIAAGLPPIAGDRERIIQILTNLVSNAHKYTPSEGSIAIDARRDASDVVIDVRDTGVGMSAEEQSHLFTKFYRAHNPKTEGTAGTGLGLAITRSLVELHGGRIEFRSEPGRGTTFSVRLPSSHDSSSTAKPADTEPARAVTGKRILVVEDEPDIANLIRRYLERAGYAVSVAHSAAEGLRLARTEAPDLLTLDVILPDSDGFTLLEWMKGDATLSEVPVLMLSIVPDAGKGLLLGAVDYLTKPVDERILLDRIGRILARDGRPSVLIAEPDPDARGRLADRLRSAGFSVLQAQDGFEAIELARAESPGLALLNVRLPGISGIRVLQALRSEPETREMAVVMLTDQFPSDEAPHSVIEELGAQLLSQPCGAVELARAIADGLGAA